VALKYTDLENAILMDDLRANFVSILENAVQVIKRSLQRCEDAKLKHVGDWHEPLTVKYNLRLVCFVVARVPKRAGTGE
jgi:hypothetical protein